MNGGRSRARRRHAAVVLLGLVLVAGVGPSATVAQQEGTVVGRPSLELFAPDNRVVGGERATLDVFVSNSGDLDRGGPAAFQARVTTARNVRLEVATDRLGGRLADAITVDTGQIPAGTIPPGTSGPFTFRFEVNESLPPGTYEIPVRVSYDYTSVVRYSALGEPEYVDSSRTVVQELALVVPDRARFRIEPTPPRVVAAGDTRVQQVTVTNVGNEPAIETELVLVTGNSSVFLGERDQQVERQRFFLSRLAPGESRTVAVTVGALSDLPPGEYPVESVLQYRNPNRVAERSTRQSFGVPVGAGQTFGVQGLEATLRVGERSTINGTLVNTGGRRVENVVLTFPPNETGLSARDPEYAAGSVGPGETVPFSFTVDVSNRTAAGPRLLQLGVRYENAAGEQRTASPVDARVEVAQEQSFAVRDVETDARVGTQGTVVGAVVNTGERPVDGAVVVLRTRGASLRPRETTHPVGSLAPDESATFRFPVDVSAAGDPGPQFLTFQVRYRGQGDEVRVSEPLDAVVEVAPEQAFALRVEAATLRVGERGTVAGRVRNTRGTTVENAALVFDPNQSGVRPVDTEYALGTLDPGETAPFEVSFDVPPTASDGPRLLQFRVRYRDENGDVRTSEPLDAEVEVAPEQSFALRPVDSTLRVGQRGRFDAALVNAGAIPVRDVSLVYQGAEGGLQPLAAETAAGPLAPGESAPVSFTFDVPPDADAGPRLLSFRVRYRGQDGEIRTSEPVDATVRVAPKQNFTVTGVESTLRVDDSGTVSGRLVNAGNVTAEGIVLLVEPDREGSIVAREREFAVGGLAPGERAPFDLRFDVTADADPGPRLLTLRVRYRGQEDQIRTTGPIDARVRVAPERDEFEVTPAESTVEAGETAVVELRVRNRENETLRDVRARLFADDPLSSDDTEAFVPALEPNESATLRFAVSADRAATAKTYPLLLDFGYEDAAGESVLSDTYFVPVSVAEPPPRRFPFAVLPALALVVGAAVAWYKRETLAALVTPEN